MAIKKTKSAAQIIHEHMSRLGRKGVAAKLAKYTPEERSEQQRKAARKRWRTTGKKKLVKTS